MTAFLRAIKGCVRNIEVGAKYRLSSVNFDQSLDSGGGTMNVGSAPGTANFLGKDLGNVSQLSSQQYGFTFQHIVDATPGDGGYVFSLTSPTGSVWTQAWGTFSPALSLTPNQSAATLPVSAAATGITPDGSQQPLNVMPINALHIEARAETRSGFNYTPEIASSCGPAGGWPARAAAT